MLCSTSHCSYSWLTLIFSPLRLNRKLPESQYRMKPSWSSQQFRGQLRREDISATRMQFQERYPGQKKQSSQKETPYSYFGCGISYALQMLPRVVMDSSGLACFSLCYSLCQSSESLARAFLAKSDWVVLSAVRREPKQLMTFLVSLSHFSLVYQLDSSAQLARRRIFFSKSSILS